MRDALPQRNLAVELLQKNGFPQTTLIRLRHLLPLPRAKEYKNPLEEISRPVPLLRLVRSTRNGLKPGISPSTRKGEDALSHFIRAGKPFIV
jgi:hypothetical protein